MVLSRTLLTGVVLAGGRAERMGGRDKGLLTLAGEPLIAHGVRRLRPQVADLLISANRHEADYRRFGCRVIGDAAGERFRGPLAGMLAALRAAATPYVLTAPCDSPRVPLDYAARMWAALTQGGAVASVACARGQRQPVFALLAVGLQQDLAAWLASGEGGVDRWLRRHRPVPVEFPDTPGWWRNVNTPHELARLEAEWTHLSDST